MQNGAAVQQTGFVQPLGLHELALPTFSDIITTTPAHAHPQAAYACATLPPHPGKKNKMMGHACCASAGAGAPLAAGRAGGGSGGLGASGGERRRRPCNSTQPHDNHARRQALCGRPVQQYVSCVNLRCPNHLQKRNNLLATPHQKQLEHAKMQNMPS